MQATSGMINRTSKMAKDFQVSYPTIENDFNSRIRLFVLKSLIEVGASDALELNQLCKEKAKCV